MFNILKTTISRFRNLFCLLILFSFFLGCEKDSPTQPTVGQIPNNIYPLEVGRKWIYNYVETDTLGRPLGNSGTYITSVVGVRAFAGKNAFIVVDSILTTDGIEVDTLLFHIDPNGNLWQYILFDDQRPEHGPGWLMTYNRQKGLNVEHIIFDTTVTEINASLRLTSIIRDKISLTVPIGHFNEVYPAELRMQLRSNLFNVTYTFNVWFVQNVGPIKFKEPVTDDFGQPIKGYKVRELRSKNF